VPAGSGLLLTSTPVDQRRVDVHAEAPAALLVPVAHCAHVALDGAPTAALAVSAGQGVGITEDVGQK
jgi:hypothetical protein